MARGDRRKTKPAKRVQMLEVLEMRLMYAVHNDSFDVTDLTQLRSDPTYSAITGKGVTIAVLDTGVDAANPDLSGKVEAFYNAVEDPVPTSITSASVSSAVDNDGHGTHVSGIAASADPNIGVAYGADLVDVKVIADSGESQLAGDPLLRGLEFVQDFASQFNIKVVNMSLGESTSSGGINDNTVPAADDISTEIQTLESLGITVVAAAGNSYANDPVPGESYPAVVSTISVANVWSDTGSGYDFATYSYGTSNDSWAAEETSAEPDQFAATSQRSTLNNQVVAPGMNVTSDWNGSSTDNSGSDLLLNTLSGTSMAAPFVSGMVALIQQAAYTYSGQYISSPEEILSIIKETSDVIPDPTIAGDQRVPISDGELTGGAAEQLPGTGDSYDRVNVLKAIQQVQAMFTGTVSNADTNDTTTTATVVPDLNGTADDTESGNIGTDGLNDVGANDVDLYSVTLDETGSLTATLSQTSGGTAFTAQLIIFNSSGGEIAAATGNSSSGYPTIITPTGSPLAEGTYYIGVSSAGNAAYNILTGTGAAGGSTTGDYTLTLSLGNPDPNGVPAGAVQVDLTDPNYEDSQTGVVSNLYNGILGSDPPPTGSSTRVTVANGDVDMFQVVAPDTGTLTADVNVSAYGFDGANSYVEVLDSNLNVITSNGTESDFPSDAQVQFNVTAGDTYYVAVTVAANANFNVTNPYDRAQGSTVTPTDYDLYLTFNNGNTDGTALLAHSETIGSTTTGDIASTNPLLGADGGSKYVDWYDYTANAAGILDLTATATSSGFSPSIELWTLGTNSSGSSDITEVGGLTGSGKSLTYQVTAGQTIYASVTGAGNSDFNWYSLGSGSGGDTGTYSLTSSLLGTSALKTLNDSSIDYGTPQTITTGQSVAGDIGMYNGLIIGASDVDLYAFTPSTSGLYDIATQTSQEGSVDTYLRVFNSSGTQLDSNDNANDSTTASLIRANLTAGETYYIGVSGSGNENYDPVTGTGATASATTGTYTLSVTAATLPAITIANPAAVSPTVAGTSVVFTISLDFATTSAVTVSYTTADGTAVAGTDYTTTAGTLTFEPGQTSATVSVPILLDTASTGSKTFTLNLSDASSNAELDGGQATATITNLPVTTYALTSKVKATYLDSNGNKVVMELTGPGTGTVTVIGTDASAVEVTLDGTTDKSDLTAVSSTKTPTDLASLQINGSLSRLDAPHVELQGDLTVTGTIGLLILAGASGKDTLSIGGANASGILELGNVSDLSVMTAEPLNEVTATQWTNADNSDSIFAPLIKTLSVKGDFGPSLTVGTNAASTAVVLNTVRIGGAITGGEWTINGSTGTIVAGSTAVAWDANFSSGVSTLQVNTNASGNISAGSIRTLKVGDNFSSAVLNFTSAGTLKNPDLNSLVVGGTFSDSVLRSTGDINSIHLGAIDASGIFAGVSPSVTTLPTTAADFVSDAEIVSVAVTGVRGATYAVTDSDIAAAYLKTVSVQKVNTANGGSPFGFATQTISSFTDDQPHDLIRLKAKQATSSVAVGGDFVLDILPG